MSTTEQTHQQDLERLKLFRYMDDDFMTACLEDNYEAVELILRIVLGQEDITIKSIRVQDSMKNLQGRSAILDVHAVDSTGKEFDVDNNEYLAINLIKIRYCEESLTYICYPFDKHHRIRIMTDTHLQVPIYKETMKPDTVLPQMTNGSLMNNTKPYKTISAMDSEENIFDILSDDAEIFSSSIDVLKDDIINSEVQFPVNIKEGNILDESKVIQLVTRA